MKVTFLNIPNYYVAYYIKGFSEVADIHYLDHPKYRKYNGRPILVFEIEGKIGVVDNDDPVGIEQGLYAECELYFATNKLLNHPDYNQPKVRPLFPHYPINIISIYLKIFGFNLLKALGPKKLLKELYTQNKRPKYELKPFAYKRSNYVFFSGSIWKKEKWANEIRATFIKICKVHLDIEFEGGLLPRIDGNNLGFDEIVTKRIYSPKEFSRLSEKSMISFNNPAVLGAVSWRLAEYWNMGLFVLSFPFLIDLPKKPVHGQNIHFIVDSRQMKENMEEIINNSAYHKKIALEGKNFFDRHCQPSIQAQQILDAMVNHLIPKLPNLEGK